MLVYEEKVTELVCIKSAALNIINQKCAVLIDELGF